MKVSPSRSYAINVIAWLYFTTTAVAFSLYLASHWEARFTPVGILLLGLTLLYAPLSFFSFQQILPGYRCRPFKTNIEFSPKVSDGIRFAALVLPTQIVGYIIFYFMTVCAAPCMETAVGHAPHISNTCMLAATCNEHRKWCIQTLTDKDTLAQWLSPESLIKCERMLFGDRGAFVTERAFAFKYGLTGDYSCSEAFWLRALDDCKKTYSPEGNKVHDCLLALGTTQFTAGNYLDAEQSYLKALEIRKKAYGENHPKTARDMAKLGAVYDKMLRFGEADRLYLQAEKIVTSRKPGMVKLARGHAQRLACLIETPEACQFKWSEGVFPRSPRKLLWSRDFVEVPAADYELLKERQNRVFSNELFRVSADSMIWNEYHPHPVSQ